MKLDSIKIHQNGLGTCSYGSGCKCLTVEKNVTILSDHACARLINKLCYNR